MKIGDEGESFAASFLKKKRCEIVERNFRCRFGEIDIIARNKEYILFVEVKTRAKNAIVGALESVDANKQRRIIAAANIYLKAHPSGLQPRFDVVAVEHEGAKYTVTDYIENAF
ncbi:MAG: YraN family protein [Ruminococcaceae bacterium]|nr:YraN family protein [Oscillospiraceae bacterium]